MPKTELVGSAHPTLESLRDNTLGISPDYVANSPTHKPTKLPSSTPTASIKPLRWGVRGGASRPSTGGLGVGTPRLGFC